MPYRNNRCSMLRAASSTVHRTWPDGVHTHFHNRRGSLPDRDLRRRMIRLCFRELCHCRRKRLFRLHGYVLRLRPERFAAGVVRHVLLHARREYRTGRLCTAPRCLHNELSYILLLRFLLRSIQVSLPNISIAFSYLYHLFCFG